jgi:uroporphyrinogen-III synthase
VKRVLVTRAKEDGERTAERLRKLGFEPLLSPVLEVVATGADIPRGAFDAVLATSAKALIHAGVAAGDVRAAPLHVVGLRSAKTVEQIGWRAEIVAASTEALLPLLRGRYGRPAHFLYLAGHDRKPELENALRADGHRVTIVETYEARAAGALTSEAAAELRNGAVDAVLHYSKRSAELFLQLARSEELMDRLRSIAHLALSPDVAGPLLAEGFARVLVAEKPDEEHLLQLLTTPSR